MSQVGRAYLVLAPDDVEVRWEECGLPIGDEAKPAKLDRKDLEIFEKVRAQYGIPA